MSKEKSPENQGLNLRENINTVGEKNCADTAGIFRICEKRQREKQVISDSIR